MSKHFNIVPKRTRIKYDPVSSPNLELLRPPVRQGGRQAGVLENVERGTLRSGGRFAERNEPYYSSVAELFKVHKKLLEQEPAVTTRIARVGESRFGSLLLTTIRFRFDYPAIEHRLKVELLNLFREHTQNARDGFEVVITFNAILCNQEETSFRVFYGQDFRTGNQSGAAPELKYGEAVVVKSLADIGKIPTSFDSERLLAAHRRAFENSNVKVYRFINIIYLIIRFLDGETSRNSRGGGIR